MYATIGQILIINNLINYYKILQLTKKHKLNI
jgi:hypothetical protein